MNDQIMAEEMQPEQKAAFATRKYNNADKRKQEEEELEKDRFDMSKTDEEIKKLMIGANKMPSVQ